MPRGFDYSSLLDMSMSDARALVWKRLAVVLDGADAAQDSPWWAFYEEIDQAFPGTRFVLTVRDRSKWLGSVQSHFGRRSNEWDRWFYEGRESVSDPDVYLAGYDEHHAAVAAYFADRPGDLLTIDMAIGMDWGPLCEFIGAPTPGYAFPTSNASGARAAGTIARVRRALWRRVAQRFGRSDVQRTMQLYSDLQAATVAARARHVDDQVPLGDLDTRLYPLIERVKVAIGVPFDPAKAGEFADDDAGRWRRLEFELRHAIGQVTSFTVDEAAGDASVGEVSRQIIDELNAASGR